MVVGDPSLGVRTNGPVVFDPRRRAMRRVSIATLSVALISGGMVMAAGPAHADDRMCRGTIGSVNVSANIIVPSGATCTLRGTRVDGNVQVLGNGAVLITGGAFIDGNVQAEDGGARYVRVRGASVVGDVQVKSGGRVIVRNTAVDGNIQVADNRGRMTIRGNSVDGDIQLSSNSARAEILNNRVNGNLQCESNSPAPVGSGNQVSGNKEGQCRSM
jgi:hypothetical protein